MKVFSSKRFVLFICICLIVDSAKGKTTYKIDPSRCILAAATATAATCLAGFGTGGILAGTCAAKLMSWTAYFYGGGVPAGSLVAFLQSLGTTGLTSYAITAAAIPLLAVGCIYKEESEDGVKE